MINIKKIYESVHTIRTAEDLFEATAQLANGIRVIEERVIDGFLQQLSSRFTQLVALPQKKIGDAEWDRFDRSFSRIMKNVIGRHQSKGQIQEHLKCVVAIESLAERRFQSLDEHTQPYFLVMKNGSLDLDDETPQEAVVSKSALMRHSPVFQRMLKSPLQEGTTHTIDLSSLGTKDAFDTVASFLQDDLTYENQIHIDNVASIFHFAIAYELPLLSESCAKFLSIQLASMAPGTTPEQLDSKLWHSLEVLIKGIQTISSRKLQLNEAQLVHHYLQCKLGRLNEENYPKYVNETTNLIRNKVVSSFIDCAEHLVINYLKRSSNIALEISFYKSLIIAYWNLDKYIDVAKYSLEIMKLNPNDSFALCYLGAARFYLRKYADAEKHLLKGIELSPNEPFALSYLGATRFRLHKPAEAEKHLLKAIELSPNEPFALCYLGAARFCLRKYADAEKHLLKGIELSPNDSFALGYLGAALFCLNKYADAEKHLLKAVGLNPNDFSYACLGVVCFHLEKHDDAKKHLVRALELNPHFSFTDVPNPALDFAQNKLEEVRKARASTQLSTSCSSSAQAG